jgi:hypothetical protein
MYDEIGRDSCSELLNSRSVRIDETWLPWRFVIREEHKLWLCEPLSRRVLNFSPADASLRIDLAVAVADDHQHRI